MKMPLLTLQNAIGAVMTGILSLLWWDIRGNRNEMLEFKQSLSNLLKNEYLRKDEHDKLCEIDTLRTERCFHKALDEHTERIMRAINKNGNNRV